MRVAALYDVHGTIAALEAVLAELARRPVDGLVGGDVASGPFPAETIERLGTLDVPARFVQASATVSSPMRSTPASGSVGPPSRRGTTWPAGPPGS